MLNRLILKPENFFAAGLLICLALFTSCNTIKPPKELPPQLDYTNQDIVQNERVRINKLFDTEPVRALWRAKLLGDEETLQKSRAAVEHKIDVSIEEKDYLSARNSLKSLKAVFPGYKYKDLTVEKLDSLAAVDIPALSATNKKNPKTIAECMQATVTIWVDRGIKVQNGSGYADVIIGSGFFIDERGYIVTNHHVIESMVDPKYEGYSRLYIKLLNDSVTKIPAKVVGYDKALDFALLKVEIVPEYVLNLGGSKDLNVGDKISAIGTPIGLEGTLTSGIISSTDRKLLTLGNVFQIDAAVNSGNSGGPVVDQNMKVQAVVFAGILQYQGLNFAIPIEYLKQELLVLYNRDEVKHPWICCFGNTKKKGAKKTGLEVQYVLPGGTASMSGLQPGDIILSLDGKQVNSIEDFNYYMMAYETETIVECKYLNSEGNEKSCLVYLELRPEDPGLLIYKSDLVSNSFVPLFGMKMLSASTINKNLYTIESVLPGSTSDSLHFSAGDSVTIREIVVDSENEYIYVQLYTKRKKKAFLDMGMALASQFDSPYYF